MSQSDPSHRLYYHCPAAHWEEALPLGSGRLGAMVWGNPRYDIVPLNEDTFWSGYPKDTGRDSDPEKLETVRKLLAEKRFNEAERLVENEFLGDYTESYEPAGNLVTEYLLPEQEGSPLPTEKYTRELLLEKALVRVSFVCAGITYTREYFASYPDNGLVMRFSADKPGALSLNVGYASPLPCTVSLSGGRISADTQAPVHVMPSYIKEAEPAVILSDPAHGGGMRARVLASCECTGGHIEEGSAPRPEYAANGDFSGFSEENMPVCRITGADCVVIRLAIRTSFNGPDADPSLSPDQGGIDEKALAERDLNGLVSRSFDDLYRRHLAEYTPYYNRSSLHLGPAAKGDAAPAMEEDLPTDVRLRRFTECLEAYAAAENSEAAALPPSDPVLYELLYNYGRYLLIASSRPGTQAANLQGIWGHRPRPVWSSNFTVNINTEMNYWPAEAANLPELAEPLFRLVRLMTEKGRETARRLYFARGSVSHHNTDIWGLTNPVGTKRLGFSFAFWPMSLGWFSRHLWDHYLYSDDLGFLRNEALPVLEACALFFLDNLRQNAGGRYIVTPGASPENTFLYEGTRCRLAAEAAMSQAICREVFTHYLAALAVLSAQRPPAAALLRPLRVQAPQPFEGLLMEASPADVEKIRRALPLLQPERVGSAGQLLEWEEEYEDLDPHHRHVSHLYGLHPAHRIRPETAPGLAEACRKTLAIRGDDGTGWSLAWKVNFHARLHDGDHALSLLNRQLRLVEPGDKVKLTGGGCYASLLDAHPPFQIDGNFGSASGILEMLVQAVDEPDLPAGAAALPNTSDTLPELLLLPALPSHPDWACGSLTGVRLPHGITLDLEWEDSSLRQAVFHVDASARKRELLLTVAGEPKGILSFPQPGDYRYKDDHLSFAAGIHPPIRKKLVLSTM